VAGEFIFLNEGPLTSEFGSEWEEMTI